VGLVTGAMSVAPPSYFADVFAVLIEMNESYSCVQKAHNRQK
jgi:hypothetical protein